jgi:hypothetical protein
LEVKPRGSEAESGQFWAGEQQLLNMNAMAKIIRSFNLSASLVIFLWISGCHTSVKPDQEETTPSTSTSSAPGFGTSNARPEGQPFVWPTGVKVLGKPKLEYDCLSDAVNKKRQYGSGGVVRFCLTLYNSGSQSVTVVFPPGLVWISESEMVQNGIIVKSARIPVPANSQLTIMLDAFCINEDRDPTDYGDLYEPQPIVTSHAGMLELSQLVANKQINDEELAKPLESTDWITLQGAVHEVEKTGKISDDSRRKLKALPE